MTVGLIIGTNVALAVGSTVASSVAAGVGGAVASSGFTVGSSSVATFIEDTTAGSGAAMLVGQVQFLNVVGRIGGEKGSASLRSYSEGFAWANLELRRNIVVSLSGTHALSRTCPV